MVELLAPAGSYDGFLGAINAGADAVYLGGEKFSARAYADNFTEEQIIKALDLAHYKGKKIYLTINTLLKDSEIDELTSYVRPYYEHGLDGVIIQDLGVSYVLKNVFPEMEIHASTQMTITGENGAKFALENGFSRIVPARELSLAEIIDIKKNVPIEVECFIHGAMCYCYSGQCLFSSILGGRSGNRGRCAQPCRLPYSVKLSEDGIAGDEYYPLSMKDMCTLQILPELIEAGIDSFKIEGRMKSPAYAAGVTAMYRKYIDLYFEKGREAYSVEKKDLQTLFKLYTRSDIETGYYHTHNGEKMITKKKPNYLAVDDMLTEELISRYVKEPEKDPVSMWISLFPGKPMELRVTDRKKDIEVVCFGGPVQEAQNRPVTEEQVEKQLQKTGNTFVSCSEIQVEMSDDVFIPLGEINALRREAVESYEDKVRSLYGYKTNRQENAIPSSEKQCESAKEITTPAIEVSVMTIEQCKTALQYQVGRIYVDADLYFDNAEILEKLFKNAAKSTEVFLALPHIARKRDDLYYEKLSSMILVSKYVKGFLLRSLEQIAFCKKLQEKKLQTSKNNTAFLFVADTNLYQMNRYAHYFTDDCINEYTLPFELNKKELKQLSTRWQAEDISSHIVLFGTLPMMCSANCIRKTEGTCDKKSRLERMQFLEDRYHKRFPVYNNCSHCYNIIYNSVPFSLHNKFEQISGMNIAWYRLDFVLENEKQTEQIIEFYEKLINSEGEKEEFPLTNFTTGHFARGVL